LELTLTNIDLKAFYKSYPQNSTNDMESFFNCWYNTSMNNKENKKASQVICLATN